MDCTENGDEGESLVNNRRQDLEELIALLDNYKLEIETRSEAKSAAAMMSAVDCEQAAAREVLVQKMILIKRKSFPLIPINGCSNNRLEDDYDSEMSDDDSGEREGLVSGDGNAVASRELDISTSSTKVSDLEELIALLNECLQEEEGNDEVDLTQASPSSKLVRRVTVVEEMLKVKRNSSHCLVPSSCSATVCNQDYMRDKFGICRKIIKFANLNRNPKTAAAKKPWDGAV